MLCMLCTLCPQVPFRATPEYGLRIILVSLNLTFYTILHFLYNIYTI